MIIDDNDAAIDDNDAVITILVLVTTAIVTISWWPERVVCDAVYYKYCGALLSSITVFY